MLGLYRITEMDPSLLQPGYQLDRYELLCPLAYGGMASVWLARFGGRLGFERLVVIKMILPQYSQDPRFQEMFLDEARIASQIEHGNVARIIDVGEHDSSYFLVMDWVDGDSLSKMLRATEQRKERVPIGVALRICADAAAGLHAAHELKDRAGSPLGVVHRDVSPQNILVANTGTTVLIDFGVAKARDRVSQDTSAGQLKGKIRYMAPEQALGRSLDRRADVWSLGAILYELFMGAPPHDGPNEVATLHLLTTGATPPPLPESTPPAVRDVITRALSHDPEARYPTALAFSAALEEVMIQIGELTPVATVAKYTAELLAERKSARRRAVDAALERARNGQAGAVDPNAVRSVSSPSLLNTPTGREPREPSIREPSMPQPWRATAPLLPAHESVSGGLGHPESPSHPSSATLGSTSMESPPPAGVGVGVRRRRFFGAALGLSVAAGVVGAVLIVGTTVVRARARSAERTQAAERSLATKQALPPPRATEDPTPPRAPAVDGTTAATAPNAAAVASAEPAPAAPAPPPSSATSAGSATRTTPVFHPRPAPGTGVGRPKPAPAGRKDYGF